MATATKEHNRYGILSAAFVVMFFVASIALFSVFLTPLSEQNGWSKTDVSLSYSIFQTVMAVTGIFSGRISDKSVHERSCLSADWCSAWAGS